MTFTVGQNVMFHGGWSEKSPRCEQCKWSCTWTHKGVVLGNAVQHDVVQFDQWDVLLETGSHVTGYEAQLVDVL